MNIIEKRVKDLKPYEKNPRLNDDAVKYVAESIKNFGFKVPLVIDKDNNIVCGHTRWKACKKLKIDTVPCVVADDLTEEQIRAYRLADNRVAEKAEWDKLIDQRVKARVYIECLQDYRYSYILKERYICGKTWQHIAEQMYLDRRWVFRLHKKALDAFDKVYQDFDH